jgi:hypothetical protein
MLQGEFLQHRSVGANDRYVTLISPVESIYVAFFFKKNKTNVFMLEMTTMVTADTKPSSATVLAAALALSLALPVLMMNL